MCFLENLTVLSQTVFSFPRKGYIMKFRIERLEERLAPSALHGCGGGSKKSGSHKGGSHKGGSKLKGGSHHGGSKVCCNPKSQPCC